jgi:hypothetical protein
MRLAAITASFALVFATSAYGAISEIEANNTCQTAQLITPDLGHWNSDGGAAVSGNLGNGDVDFYSVFVKAPGILIAAAIFDFTPLNGIDNDSYIGLYDPDCNLVAVDDDTNDVGSPNFLSALHWIVDRPGLWTWAITGFGDQNFDGQGHNENFPYLLLLGMTPEPGTMGLLLLGAGLLARRRR